MSIAISGIKPRNFGDLVTICRSFVAGYAAFLKLGQDSRSDVEELVSALDEGDLEVHEREGVFGTLAHMLFPGLCRTLDDAGSEEFCDGISRESEQANRELDREEESFAQRLNCVMDAKGVTQTALASMIGVRQSAISMMLSRKSRPQRRTVEKIARALGISSRSLWPEFQGSSVHYASSPHSCWSTPASINNMEASPGDLQPDPPVGLDARVWPQPPRRGAA